MIAQYPAGPGGNPKLDNSALQGIWDIYRKEAGDYDAAMVDSWNASIDNLILFVRETHCSGVVILIIFDRLGYSLASSQHFLLNRTKVSHLPAPFSIIPSKTTVEHLDAVPMQPESTRCGLPALP